MQIKQIKVYSFSELSEEAQEKAIETERDYKYQSCDMLYFFQEDVDQQLKEKYWDDIKLAYSLSCCQGDGLSFSGELNLKAFLDNVYSVKLPEYKKWALNEYIYPVYSTGNTGHYCYANKNQIEYDYNCYDKGYQKIEKLWQDVLEEIKEYYVTLCKEFEKQGYNEIEYQLSDECIKEELENNNIEYTEDGRIFNY